MKCCVLTGSKTLGQFFCLYMDNSVKYQRYFLSRVVKKINFYRKT